MHPHQILNLVADQYFSNTYLGQFCQGLLTSECLVSECGRPEISLSGRQVQAKAAVIIKIKWRGKVRKAVVDGRSSMLSSAERTFIQLTSASRVFP